MTETRRKFLGGALGMAGGIAGASLLGAKASAFAPQILTQAPGFYRYKIGAFEATAVNDGLTTMPLPANFVTNVDRAQVNQALEADGLPKDEVTIVFTPVVINTGSKLIVIDTGMGPGNLAKTNGASGQFHNNLEAAGVKRDSVDAVVISHFHFDHINGLLDAAGKPAFADAEILVPAPEWAFWMDDGQMSRANDGLKSGFANVRRVFGALPKKPTLYDPNKEIVAGLQALPTHGHTPGHCSFRVSSDNASVLITSDLTNLPSLFLRHPGWHVMFDMDPVMAEQARIKAFDMASADKLQVQGYHYPFPATGRIMKTSDGFDFIPGLWRSKV